MYKIEPLQVNPHLTYDQNVQAHGKKYPTLCVLPFIQLCTSNFGFVRMCNRSRNIPANNGIGRVWVNDKDDVMELLNQDYLIQARQKKLAGERLQACERCYLEEDAGLISKRMRELYRFWNVSRPALNEAIENEGRVKSPPVYLDLKLGNVCNLSCTYCAAPTSSSLFSENRAMNEKNILPSWQTQPLEETETHLDKLKFAEAESFWRKMELLTPTLDTVFFEGAEPTLSASVKKFLRFMVDSGHSSRIRIKFTTNMTRFDQSWIDLLAPFKQVSLFCSIDGVGWVQDVIRYGSKFNIIEDNFRRVLEIAPAHIKIHLLPAITVMNAEHLVELFRWKEALDVYNRAEIGINTVYEPRCLCIKILDDKIKDKVKTDLIGYLATSKTKLIQRELEREILSVVRFMEIPHKDMVGARAELLQYLKGLTRVRKHDYAQLFSHLLPTAGTLASAEI